MEISKKILPEQARRLNDDPKLNKAVILLSDCKEAFESALEQLSDLRSYQHPLRNYRINR